MRTECLPIPALLTVVLGAVTAAGCSEDSAQGNGPNGSGGASSSTGGSGTVTGGAPATGGQAPTGGVLGNTGGSPATGGVPGTGGKGAATGGSGAGGAATGGTSGGTNAGAPGKGGSGNGGSGTAGGGAGGAPTGGSGGKSGGSGGEFTGTCTASKSTGKSVSGSGPHKVVIETNSEAGIKCGTIFRPEDLGDEKYPILVWGEGGCSQDGLSNQAAMGEIASWGYFIVADGTPGQTNACAGGQNGKAFLDYITWAIAENDKPCSAYYQSLETTKIAADGFSCGGLMAENVSGDPRFTAIGITSSGLMGSNAGLYDKMHAPFKIMNGGPDDIAYENGLRDYDEVIKRDIPTVYFSKTSAGHGGDLGQARGDFNKVNLAWLNWQLKGDEGATGKGYLHGATCTICTNSGWTYKSANIP
jgi:hypothetical protein